MGWRVNASEQYQESLNMTRVWEKSVRLYLTKDLPIAYTWLHEF